MLPGTERFPMHTSSRVSFLSLLIALILLLCAKSMSLSIIEPYLPVEVPPHDTAKVSFTALHTLGRNWLQVQIAPVGACQQIVVDSVKVLDSALPQADSSRVFHIGAPRRDVRVWWRLLQQLEESTCGNVVASRSMVELPRPPRSPASDTLLSEWAPGEVQALGPGGRSSRAFPDMVDQTSNIMGMVCPMYTIVCPIVIKDSSAPKFTARDVFMDSARVQFLRGLPVVRIKGTGDSVLVRIPQDSIPTSIDLGPRTMWKAGNEASVEEIPVRTVRSWGGEAPAFWRKRTGRHFYKWLNNPGPCCDNCDTLCQRGSFVEGISSSGPDVELSNDSTRGCRASTIQRDLKSALQGEWLVFPDSSELKTGRFKSTLENRVCFPGRMRAYPVQGDSFVFGSQRAPLTWLDEAVVGAIRPGKNLGVRIVSTSEGMIVRTGFRHGESWKARLIAPDGKTQEWVPSTMPELELGTGARGVLLVQISGPKENGFLRVIR